MTCWLGGSALIRLIVKIVRSSGNFNVLCCFGGRDLKSPMGVGATGTAAVIFRAPMVHMVGTGCGVAPPHVIP